MNEATLAKPKLLKERQLHSRIFAVALVGLILVCHPYMSDGNTLRHLMMWIGYICVMVGAFGRVLSSAYIGGIKNTTVVRAGPFSVVRNPLYVFSFIATVGIALQSGMISLLILLAGSYIYYYPKVVAKEEAYLRHKFGADYDAYVAEVPRWIPNMKLWVEPEQIESKPKFIRRTLMDAAIFFLPLPSFALIGWLQEHSILPIWLTLP